MEDIVDRVEVNYCDPPDDWYERGGTQEDADEWLTKEGGEGMFFRMKYDNLRARFTSLDFESEFSGAVALVSTGMDCPLCRRKRKVRQEKVAVVEVHIGDDMEAKSKIHFRGDE